MKYPAWISSCLTWRYASAIRLSLDRLLFQRLVVGVVAVRVVDAVLGDPDLRVTRVDAVSLVRHPHHHHAHHRVRLGLKAAEGLWEPEVERLECPGNVD